MQLVDVRPPVWRRLEVSSDTTLAGLHTIVQAAFGWLDYHLHEFEIDGRRYGQPDPDWDFEPVMPEARTALSRVVSVGSRIRYVYDFGDDWRHDIRVEKVFVAEPDVSYPRCTAGRRACPPEDVGGPWGYEGFLEALADPDHPEHEEYQQWVGYEFDPAAFHLAQVNEDLQDLAST